MHSGDYKLTIVDRYQNCGERYRYRLTVQKLETDFQLIADADAIVINTDKPTEFNVTVNRVAGLQGSLGPITVEAIDLPDGITCKPVVSEPEGDSSKKVSLSFESNGIAHAGPIRIKGTAIQPQPMERFCVTPAKFRARTNVIWVTAVAGKDITTSAK
jgi:hypothetical protein